MSLDLSAFLLLTFFAVTAAFFDWKLRRIPNWLCLVVAACGLGIALLHGGWPQLGSHALHLLIALAAGMVLFRIQAIGGGDAKFYAAVAAWFPVRQGAALLVNTSLAGLVLFLCWVAVRRAMGVPFRIREPRAFDKFPYGVAIGAGALLSLGWQTLR